jgi:hypothetical protein
VACLGHPWKHVELATSVEGVLLFVGGNQGKEFTLSVKGSDGGWFRDAPLRVGHTCGPRGFVQDGLTAAVIRRT